MEFCSFWTESLEIQGSCGAAKGKRSFCIHDLNEIENNMDMLREAKGAMQAASAATLNYIKRNVGATDTILSYLKIS
jgi:hypothetical protein